MQGLIENGQFDAAKELLAQEEIQEHLGAKLTSTARAFIKGKQNAALLQAQKETAKQEARDMLKKYAEEVLGGRDGIT